MAELNISKLGRYQIKGVLGRGAMGVVYEGLDPALNRRVAIKTILKNAAIDAETAQHYSAQFAREAQAAGRLNHPNIVGVHDFAEEGEIAYLVMEFIQGRELRSFFDKKEKFEVAETVRIMGELLDALDFAHEAGVIHRDVKPANVMLDAQRRVKLADFGVARIQDSEKSAAGTMVGTPAFMSPEQISGGKIDRRTDLFSAGVVLYQLLTGEQPFTGAGAWTVAKKIMQDDPPQPSSMVQSVSPVFDAIVNKALAKKAADRFASAKEFAAVLRGALGPQPSAMVSMPPMPAPKQAKAAPQASETELEFWKAIQNSTDAAEFEFYLEQFPEGTYAALARHKIARLSSSPAAEAQDTVRLEAEAAARRKAAEEKAQQEAEAQARARREAEEKARQEASKAKQEAAEKAMRDAAEKAKREAEDKARREAETRARVEAELKAKREADEKARQAQALAKLKQQEEAAARARATLDEDATIAISQPVRAAAAPAARPPQPAVAAAEPPRKSFLVPAVIGAVVVVAAAGTFFALSRKPAPVAEAPAPTAPAAPQAAAPAAPAATVVDEAKIRREVEERIRREYADKSAAEQAAAARIASDKAILEKKAAAKSAIEKQAADKAAAEKAAAEKAMAEKLAAAKSAGERAALEKIAADKAAADKAAAEKAAADAAAAERAAAEKAAADKAAAERAAAERQVASVNVDAQLEKFTQRKGAHKVVPKEPPFTFSAMNQGEVIYVNDGTCPRGMIKEVTSDMRRQRTRRCISLD